MKLYSFTQKGVSVLKIVKVLKFPDHSIHIQCSDTAERIFSLSFDAGEINKIVKASEPNIIRIKSNGNS